MADYYEEVCKHTKNAKKVCNWITGDVSAYLNKKNTNFDSIEVKPEYIASLVDSIGFNQRRRIIFHQPLNRKHC